MVGGATPSTLNFWSTGPRLARNHRFWTDIRS